MSYTEVSANCEILITLRSGNTARNSRSAPSRWYLASPSRTASGDILLKTDLQSLHRSLKQCGA
jgi:hypothetical protein